MPKVVKKKKFSAEEIAKKADQGEDISKHFSNNGKMMPPIQRVNVDFTMIMLDELDFLAEQMNISRQAVIKTLIKQGLDQHHLAQNAKKASGE